MNNLSDEIDAMWKRCEENIDTAMSQVGKVTAESFII